MRIVDLRSDTVTQPTPEMREAIANASLGDDVFGEDPTVNRLEEMAAEKLGKEAAVLVSSGTQGNLTAILSHCQRGDEVVLGNKSHSYLYEAGGVSAFGGVHVRTVPTAEDGSLDALDIEGAIRPENQHFPHTALVCMENTHNLTGGRPLGLGKIGRWPRSPRRTNSRCTWTGPGCSMHRWLWEWRRVNLRSHSTQ